VFARRVSTKSLASAKTSSRNLFFPQVAIIQKNMATTAVPTPEKYFLLQYEYVEGMLEKRAPHRPEHLELAHSYANKGELLIAGAYDPPTGATFIFKTKSEAEAFVNSDPYVKNGLVPSHKIIPYNVVTGANRLH